MKYNIFKIQNGFIFNDKTYEITDSKTFDENDNILEFNNFIVGNSVFISTNLGVIMLDLTCTINEVKYTDINEFANALTDQILL